ncbi:Uncharacterized protein QTN25_005110 [Entamoeba marina]
MNRFSIQGYNDDHTEFEITPQQVKRTEQKAAIINIARQYYQVVIPIICMVLAMIKLIMAIRLFRVCSVKSKFRAKRDFHAKLGPLLNPWHVAYLDLASAFVFCVLPIWCYILKKKIEPKILLQLCAFCLGMVLFMNIFTNMRGSLWLFGINLLSTGIFYLIDYGMKVFDNSTQMLNRAYSV